MAHVLDTASTRSLVLVDELGRATSTADGTAIAWSVCEALLAARAPTLFATHFLQLADLARLYPAARLWQLEVSAQPRFECNPPMQFSYVILARLQTRLNTQSTLLQCSLCCIPWSVQQNRIDSTLMHHGLCL